MIISLSGRAELYVNYEAEALGNISSNSNFAPYYIASNVDGTITQSKSGYARLKGYHAMDTTKRFSFGFGLDMIGGGSSKTAYDGYDLASKSWYKHNQGPANFWIQQLDGEVKWRGMFLMIGSKQQRSALFNHSLGSGDITESGNARPIPQVRIGLINFQNKIGRASCRERV